MATRRIRGGALLAVLWLSAALGAIAFSLASTVRAEIDRASTAVDGTRAYYLAQGAVQRAILYLDWATREPTRPDGSRRYYAPGDVAIPLSFPSGEALVEVIPETAKLNVNLAPPEELLRLIVLLGVPPERAQAIVLAILDWRTPGPDNKPQLFAPSTFRPHHASIEETEELLLIRGMTPELYYGGYDRNAEGRLVPRGGLADCLSVFGSIEGIDANSAQPAVLGAIGINPGAVAAIVERRRVMPFRNSGQLASFVRGAGPGAQRLRIGGKSIFTLRATARLRIGKGQLSDLRRTVAATVKLDTEPGVPPAQILRWYDTTWIN
ncbi:MAG: general secretion pathway protein GspK [Candidatus Solibacter usitatus]|nr:general secretion pathway protein GspK [Candidatus Solibacter usitatus]